MTQLPSTTPTEEKMKMCLIQFTRREFYTFKSSSFEWLKNNFGDSLFKPLIKEHLKEQLKLRIVWWLEQKDLNS